MSYATMALIFVAGAAVVAVVCLLPAWPPSMRWRGVVGLVALTLAVLTAVFDSVMIAEGYEHLVRNRRPVADDIDESDPVKRLGKREKGATFAPFSFRQIIELIILLPLNFVPFVGVPLFV